MKAITTKYLGPTNTKGSRIKASDEDGNSVTVSKNSSLDTEAAHAEAARALCDKMKWYGTLQGGSISNGMVWTWLDKKNQITATGKR